MAEKIKKSLSWFSVLTLLCLLGFVYFHLGKTTVRADDLGTSVTVGNEAPSFTDNPHEDPSSHNSSGTGDTAGNPTNVGSNVTFKATASDPNSDDYYLIVCTTNAVSPGTEGGAPTCDVGTWCTSSSTADDVEASCTYQTQAGDSESNTWYAFVCDAASSNQACSSSDQGTGQGNAASPFYVNHVPTFTAYSDDSGKNPGQTVTWTTTSEDPDSDAADDTVTLYVCKTAAFSGGASPSCTGGEWCHDASPGVSNSGCTYDIPTPTPDQDLSAYGYIIDNHGFQASEGEQGSDSTLTVNNVAPTIAAANIDLLDTDGDGNLTLTTEEGETQDFLVEFIVTDNNSCQNSTAGDEIASAIIHVYRSGVTQSNCDSDGEDNANNCYANAEQGTSGTCVQDESVDACSGASDSTVGWRCEFPLQFHADPTVANSVYEAQNWLVSVQATDDDTSDSALTEGADGNEMDMFMAYDITQASVAYGSVSAGNDSSEQTVTVEATGNVGLDENLSGADMTDGGNTIVVGQQHYNLTASEGWTNGTALTTGATEVELNCSKTTTTGSPATANTYWVLRVPDGQIAGTYSGTNTIAGVTGESGSW
jgi:hypothetical protein